MAEKQKRVLSPEYANELDRIADELAKWLTEQSHGDPSTMGIVLIEVLAETIKLTPSPDTTVVGVCRTLQRLVADSSRPQHLELGEYTH